MNKSRSVSNSSRKRQSQRKVVAQGRTTADEEARKVPGISNDKNGNVLAKKLKLHNTPTIPPFVSDTVRQRPKSL